jgi:hypothetical protein
MNIEISREIQLPISVKVNCAFHSKESRSISMGISIPFEAIQ